MYNMLSLLGMAVVANGLALSSAVGVEIVAHRGASYDAPENTIAAFRLAWEQGADGAEGDFYLSADGHIVCLHDRSLKRTAGSDRVVDKVPLNELKRFDVGKWKAAKYEGERIPTLVEVFEIVPEGKTLLIEVKCGPEIVPQLKMDIDVSAISKDQLEIIAFNAEVIAACRKALPDVKAHWLTSWRESEAGFEPSEADVLATLKRVNASGLDASANPNILTEAFRNRLEEQGYELHCWTVNDPALAKKMIDAGVKSITTDRPGWLREQLGK